MMNSLRLISAIFEPFIPSLSAKMNFTMNLPRTLADDTFFRNLS